MTPEERNAQMLQDALNGQITDDTGALVGNDDPTEDSDPQEQTTDTETASSEKSAESEESTPKVEDDESETSLAEDESGKQYVPKSRFDKVYGKQKALERELEALKQQAPKTVTSEVEQMFPQVPVQTPEQDTSSAAVLEQEILFDKFPQFNPESTDYNPALDQLGGRVAKTFPDGTSRLVIARETMRIAKELTAQQAEVVAQSRQIKASQADQGVTSRVAQRTETKADPSKMSLDELEAHLKETGEWDRF